MNNDLSELPLSENSIDIKSLPGAGVFQLVLPEQVATRLQLKQPDGHVLFIIHENKMKLEWLAQSIWKQYQIMNNAFISGKTRLNRKKRVAVIVLLFTALIAVFRSGLATLTHINLLYINATVFTLGVMCCMQLLKYFAMGMKRPDETQVSGIGISELKELIQKDYSPEV
ncbi:MAG: hypothetical protein Q8918_18040 [Bacteroidota bacterium]|nr:hypothetical protein [Bacteroidota bacterium]MDP4252006.1 hypothetical protein [Bacteroidota bacterium]